MNSPIVDIRSRNDALRVFIGPRAEWYVAAHETGIYMAPRPGWITVMRVAAMAIFPWVVVAWLAYRKLFLAAIAAGLGLFALWTLCAATHGTMRMLSIGVYVILIYASRAIPELIYITWAKKRAAKIYDTARDQASLRKELEATGGTSSLGLAFGILLALTAFVGGWKFGHVILGNI